MTPHHFTMTRQSLLFLFPVLVAAVAVAASDDAAVVPLMIWKTSAPGMKSTTTPNSVTRLKELDPEDILSDEISPIVAFIQNRLDMEQFSLNGPEHLSYFSQLFDQTDAELFPYSRYLPEFYSSNRVDKVVPLNGDTLEDNEATIKSYVEHLNQTSNGPVVFLLTGKQNPRYETELARHRRAAGDGNSKTAVLQCPDSDPCVYLYAETVSLQLFDNTDKKTETYMFEQISITNCSCKKSDSDKKKETKKLAESVELHFSNDTTKKMFSLAMTFGDPGKAWYIKSLKLIDMSDAREPWEAENISISTEKGFSYSCEKSHFLLGKINKTSHHLLPGHRARLQFERFQLQPFVIKESRQMFQPSFDCSVWFTLPLLAGLLVTLLMVAILYCGIRAVMSISTPDRFENPKSKGLILTNVEE